MIFDSANEMTMGDLTERIGQRNSAGGRAGVKWNLP